MKPDSQTKKRGYAFASLYRSVSGAAMLFSAYSRLTSPPCK